MTSAPSAQLVRSLLTYEMQTGVFNWRRAPTNQVQAGAKAGWIEARGYRRICIGGKSYQAHRLAWLYVTGSWPEDQIDHINLNRSDNRWSNLRAATNSQNQANVGPSRRSSSGIKGVYWHRRIGKWHASIMFNRRLICLGYRNTKEEAAALYAAAAKKFFGQFARTA